MWHTYFGAWKRKQWLKWNLVSAAVTRNLVAVAGNLMTGVFGAKARLKTNN